MDIKRFLSSGSTYIHEAKKGLLSTMAPLAIGLMAAAGVQANERADTLAQVERPGDMASRFYQRLGAPDDPSRMLVSSNSPEISRVFQQVPESLLARTNKVSPDLVSAAIDSNFLDLGYVGAERKVALALNLTEQTFYGRELGGERDKVSFINGAEAVAAAVKKTASGRGYVDFSGSLPYHMSDKDAMFFVTLHEIFHGANASHFDRASPFLNEYERVYRSAVNEVGADLYAVLNYASKEGSYDNGLAVVNALRSARLIDAEHETTDMLGHVLERMPAEQFVGRSPGELVKVVDQIITDLDPLNNPELKSLYARSVAEKLDIQSQIPGVAHDVIEHNQSFKTGLARHLGVSLDGISPEGRAQKMLDALITEGVRNKDLNLELGGGQLARFQDVAREIGVELAVYQVMRASVFDRDVSIDGERISPLESDRQLAVHDHFEDMWLQHQAEEIVRRAAFNQQVAAAAPAKTADLSQMVVSSHPLGQSLTALAPAPAPSLTSDLSQWEVVTSEQMFGSRGVQYEAQLQAFGERWSPPESSARPDYEPSFEPESPYSNGPR